jgi:hypothetical protein
MKSNILLKLLIIAILFLGLLDYASAQTWARTFAAVLDEFPFSIIETKDRSLIVAGSTGSFSPAGTDDIWLIKINPEGNIIWQKKYGDDSMESVKSIYPTSDGGCILLGTILKIGSCCTDLWVLKLDKFGNIEWQKTYGGVEYEEAGSVQQTKDGSYVVVGTTGSFGVNVDIWIIRLDGQGNIIWQNAYGTSGVEFAYSVTATKKNGYIVAGNIAPCGLVDSLVFRLDSSGNVLWSKSFSAAGNDWVYAIDHASGGNYIVFGTTDSTPIGTTDFWALQMNRRGKVLWQRQYGTVDYESGASLKRTSDGGHVFVGTRADATSDNIALVKLDPEGHASVLKNFGGPEAEQAFSVTTVSDGGYAVTGFTRSFGNGSLDMWVLKLDSAGDVSDSCVYESEKSITETNSDMVTSDFPLTVTSTSVTAIDTTVIPVDTSGTTDLQCSN